MNEKNEIVLLITNLKDEKQIIECTYYDIIEDDFSKTLYYVKDGQRFRVQIIGTVIKSKELKI